MHHVLVLKRAQNQTLYECVQLEFTHPDNVWLRDTISACKWLGLAFFFTSEPKYAAQLRRRVRVFFTDDTTGMLPNLKYAQSIPGVTDGRAQVNPWPRLAFFALVWVVEFHAYADVSLHLMTLRVTDSCVWMGRSTKPACMFVCVSLAFV